MSDYIVKIIPIDPYLRITDKQAQSALQYLKQNIKADLVKMRIQESPEFVDCGANLESISCPICNKQLDFGWWNVAMDKASKINFMDLSIKLPCCSKDSTLNDLIYYFPCGFSTFEYDIVNPLMEVNDSLISELQRLLEITVSVIHAHI